MGYQWIDDDDDDDDIQQAPAAKADLPAPARQHMRKVEKENAELKKKIDELSASQRKSSVSDVLKAKGYDPLVAGFIPSTVETSDEAIGKWLDEHAAVLAKVATTEDTTAIDEGANDGSIPPEIAQALGMVTNASAAAHSPDRMKDLLSQINDPNLTPEKLDALIRGGGRS